jgi:SpoVK/Ycf46/Vps4 family AAA+-type ATPase
MGLPTHVEVDKRIAEERIVRNALETADVTPMAEESVARLHRVFYPVFRVEYSYASDDGFFARKKGKRTGTTLIDGLWSGNDPGLNQYTEDAETTESVPVEQFDLGTDHEGLGTSVLLEFQATDSHAGDLLPDRIERYLDEEAAGDRYLRQLQRTFGFPDAFEPHTFDGVESVERLYLPFWLAEFHSDREDSAMLYVFRSLEDIRSGDRPHQWLSSFVSEDPMRLSEYGHRVSLDAGEATDAGDEAVPEDDADETSAAEQPTERPVVQPEGVEMDAERLLDPPPARSFADVGGMDDLKKTLEKKVLDPLAHPERYAEYGIGTVTGVLLHGPPGCGKTYIAGALAGELGHNVVELGPADLTSKYMGQPADNVADAFEIARANQPCVVFIDEIDAVAGSRDGEMNTSEQQMVNQLLAELEAVADEDVIVVAATNLLEDVDRAIRRSGRFDERIEVPPPDADARSEILRLYLDERPTDDPLDLDAVVSETAGYAASDVEHVADEAARRALHEGAPIDESHLLDAVAETTTSIPEWAGRVDDAVDVVEPDGVELHAHRLVEPNPGRTFADVGGMNDLKARLTETVIDPVRNADRYAEYGIDVTDGVLLHGPPGCGKTYVAGALAGELGVNFLPVTPADITSKWMGRPAKNVADLFTIAKANAPCLLFIDEIDAVAGSRGGEMNTSEQQMVNQLLAELEAAAEEDVIVVAATNLLETVDRAIRRSGRFDERIEVPPPDADARREILQVHLRERPVADDIDWTPVVEATEGYAASDLELVADSAAREALRADVPVGTDHLLSAVETTTSSLGGDQGSEPTASDAASRYIR